jgi:hypothetical protein
VAFLADQERDQVGDAGLGAGLLQPGRDGVDRDLAATQLAREHSRDCLNGTLARRVGAIARGARPTTELETLTIAPPSRSSREVLPVDHERAAHVGPLLGVERFEVVVNDWTDDHLPCGVHHDVDTPERLDRLGEQPLDVELVRDVGADARAMPSAARISSTAASA